ncbi:hypothetical protein ACIQ9E_21520 [Streptomyces sp. NPDC094448]
MTTAAVVIGAAVLVCACTVFFVLRRRGSFFVLRRRGSGRG